MKYLFTILPNFGSPDAFIPGYAFVSAGILDRFSSIGEVLRIITFSEIVFLVIQSIAVYVVNKGLGIRNAHNLSVHKDCLYPYSTSGINPASYGLGVPFELIEILKPVVRNPCNHALSQMYFFHACLQTNSPVRHGLSTTQRADKILSRFHLLSPSEFIDLIISQTERLFNWIDEAWIEPYPGQEQYYPPRGVVEGM
jgi:hypothetical protein